MPGSKKEQKNEGQKVASQSTPVFFASFPDSLLYLAEARGEGNVAANSWGEGKAVFAQRQWALEYKLKLFFHSCLWLALALTSHKCGRWRKPLFSPHCIIAFILFSAVLLRETKFIFIAVVQG